MKTLYKLDTTKSIQQWSIIGKLEASTIIIRYGQMGGSLIEKKVQVTTNQSGRSIREQMLLEIKSRISKQKAKGYRDTIQEARANPNLNELNLPRPMLAQPLDKVGVPNEVLERMWRQYKYDGHRMLVTNNGGELIAYSRNGKIINTVNHILQGIDIPEGVTLDGELYCHGQSLQTIASWVKRFQENTLSLLYMVYDQILPVGFETRRQLLLNYDLGKKTIMVATWKDTAPISQDLQSAIKSGYEGIMLRHPDMPYNSGARCKSLIKVKQLMDAEFEVVDIKPSSDGWAILVCTYDGKQFDLSAPGTIAEKTEVLQNKHAYIGKKVNAQFFSFTDKGLPFHAAARYWRDPDDE